MQQDLPDLDPEGPARHAPRWGSAVRRALKPGLVVEDASDRPDWDARLWRHHGANIFTATPWGTYKARTGWRVRRIVIRSCAGDDLGFTQIQTRRLGPGRFHFVQGGPVLTAPGRKRAEDVLAALLGHIDPGRLDLVGIRYEQFASREATLALLTHGFRPVVSAANHTLELDLAQDLDAVIATLDHRRRKALRKAERNTALTTHFLTDPGERLRAFDDFAAMYDALRARKNFASGLDTAAYRDLAARDPQLLFLDLREDGVRILVRIAHLGSGRCTDFYNASNARARATGAAWLAVWRLVHRAKAEGCRTFDLGGIDPAVNQGVFRFKRSLSADVVQTGPLWLHGRMPLLRDAAAALLARR